MDIQSFISKVNKAGGLAPLNRYSVTILPPSLVGGLRSIGNVVSNPLTGLTNQGMINRYFGFFGVDPITATRGLELLCDATSLPGLSYATTDTKTYGPSWKDPYDINVDTTTKSFYCGADMMEKKFFDAWQYMVKDPVTNDFNFSNEYTTQIIIKSKDYADTSNYGVRLIDAWPLSVNAVDMSYGSENSVMKMSVTFTYKKWFNLEALDTIAGDIGEISSGIKSL